MRPSLEEIHDQLVAAVEGLVSSDEWRAMLKVSARFHNYSFNNQLLIYLQCPEVTRVAAIGPGSDSDDRFARARAGSRSSLPAVSG